MLSQFYPKPTNSCRPTLHPNLLDIRSLNDPEKMSASQPLFSLKLITLLYDKRLKIDKLTFYKKTLAFCKIPWYHLTCISGCGSAWLERRLREAEVASSNPATPIHLKASKSFTRFWRLLFCIIFAALENCRKNLKNLKNGLLFIKFYAMIVFVPGCGSAWLERRLREAEVASSNPATPIH